jgi:hypothetical protein
MVFEPVKLPEIVGADRNLSGVQIWIAKEPNQLSLVSALEVDGVTLAGVQLRMRAITDLPDRAVMIQLEYNPPKGRNERLIRVEWRPLAPHVNNGKAPSPYEFMTIAGSHIHRFEHNYNVAGERMVRNNLPHAIPLEPDPENFRELLELAGKELNISDLHRVETPEWQARMV